MAWLKEISRPRCNSCPRPASVTLMNCRNAPCAVYCKACSKKALRDQEYRERQHETILTPGQGGPR